MQYPKITIYTNAFITTEEKQKVEFIAICSRPNRLGFQFNSYFKTMFKQNRTLIQFKIEDNKPDDHRLISPPLLSPPIIAVGLTFTVT